MILLSDKEKKTMLQARLRNMKRKYSKIKEHADLTEQAIDLKAEIEGLQREIDHMQ